ncbi:MAG: hypothetical protein LBR90_02965 [Elusimicrobiota bacterium]|jgi:hypothetical protein|nr:hypothetical protein [Elusimicrobiota bacterium]
MVERTAGKRRVFLFALALAFILQIVLFAHAQFGAARALIMRDFRVAVVLGAADAPRAGDFLAALQALRGVEIAAEADPKAALSKAGAGNLLADLSPDLLPRFYEVRLSAAAAKNPAGWVKNTLNAAGFDARAYYKEGPAAAADYLRLALRFVNVFLAFAALAFVSFGFFVEAYYISPTSFKTRFGALFAALLAYAVSLAALYVLITPLNNIYPVFAYHLSPAAQAGAVIICALTGWTLAKWKRF